MILTFVVYIDNKSNIGREGNGAGTLDIAEIKTKEKINVYHQIPHVHPKHRIMIFSLQGFFNIT